MIERARRGRRAEHRFHCRIDQKRGRNVPRTQAENPNDRPARRNPTEWASVTKPLVQGLLETNEQFVLRCVSASKTALSHEELLVRWYLKGTVVPDKADRHHLVYAPIDVEADARELLAQLLRSDVPINRDIRDALAILIDPNQGPEPHAEREFRFAFRSRKRPNKIRDLQICDHIANCINRGIMVKIAVDDVMQKYKLGRRKVLGIWGEYKDTYEKLGWVKRKRKSR